MSWSRVDDGFASHPKVRRLLHRHGIDGVVAVGWWALQLSESYRDGTVDTELALARVPGVDPALVAPLLVEVGLLDELAPGSWAFHDWLDYRPAGRERQSFAGKRRAAGPRDARGRLVSPASAQLPPASTHGQGTSSVQLPQAGGEAGHQLVQPTRPVPVPTPNGVRDGSTAQAPARPGGAPAPAPTPAQARLPGEPPGYVPPTRSFREAVPDPMPKPTRAAPAPAAPPIEVVPGQTHAWEDELLEVDPWEGVDPYTQEGGVA